MISVTDAARSFADVVNRAFYRRETTVLLKNGVPVVCIAPTTPHERTAGELAAAWDGLFHLSEAEAAAFARELDAARAELPPLHSVWE